MLRLAHNGFFWYGGAVLRKILPRFGAYLLIACVAVGIYVHLPEQAALPEDALRELAELNTKVLPELMQDEKVESELVEIMHEVVQHFNSTGKVNYVVPDSGIGILHVACLLKQPALLHYLLTHGADPNRHAPEDDSPLLLAVGTQAMPNCSAQQINDLVDMLLAAGADPMKAGDEPGDFLTQAAFTCEHEEVLLHLLDRGIAPDQATTLAPALHGWPRSLRRLLHLQPNTRGLMHAAALGSSRYPGQHIECMELLLAAGAGVNDDEQEAMPGSTPALYLAQELSSLPPEDPLIQPGLDALDWLLRHGADPYRRVENDEIHPGWSCYDFISTRPELLAALNQRGHHFQAPELRFTAGTALPAELCRAVSTGLTPEQLAPHYEVVSTLLTPSPAMLQQELYAPALEQALPLLAAVNPQDATARILSSPLWQAPAGPELTALLTALHAPAAPALPKEHWLPLIETWARAGREDDAALAAELLGRSPGSEGDIERLMHSPYQAVQAGAYAAYLRTAGLPDARNGGVTEWLRQHKRKADTEFLREAELLTSLDDLWYGRMTPARQEQLLGLMRRIGATTAAAAFEAICRHLDDPAALDAIMQGGDAWKYELEAATARFFIEHAAELTPTPEP